MTRLVRILDDKSWFDPMNPDSPLVEENVRADAAVNFCAENCTLSFFKLEGDDAVVERIAAAVSAGGPQLEDVDYWIVESAALQALGCRLDQTVAGVTLLEDVNRLHVDVCDIDLRRLAKLVMLAVQDPQTGRVRRAKVKDLLLGAIADKTVDPDRLRKGVREFLKV